MSRVLEKKVFNYFSLSCSLLKLVINSVCILIFYKLFSTDLSIIQQPFVRISIYNYAVFQTIQMFTSVSLLVSSL